MKEQYYSLKIPVQIVALQKSNFYESRWRNVYAFGIVLVCRLFHDNAYFTGIYCTWLGTFTESANVDYHLSFADEVEQTSISICRKQREVCRFRFCLKQTNRSCRFPQYTYAAISNGKQKPKRISIIRLPFAHHANRKFAVCLFVNEETNENYPFETD
jgi:hypothetical protein